MRGLGSEELALAVEVPRHARHPPPTIHPPKNPEMKPVCYCQSPAVGESVMSLEATRLAGEVAAHLDPDIGRPDALRPPASLAKESPPGPEAHCLPVAGDEPANIVRAEREDSFDVPSEFRRDPRLVYALDLPDRGHRMR